MQELEKILEEFGSYICDDLCYYRETSADKKDDEMEEICAGCKAGEYLESICKHMNDGWIPVEERLPEEKKSVLVQWEKYDRHLNVTLIYLDVMWLDDAEEQIFETINGVPNGKVIAWRPLPEPYRPERSGE